MRRTRRVRLTRTDREEIARHERRTSTPGGRRPNPAQSELLNLQRAAGNTAVSRMVAARVDRAQVPYDENKPLRWKHFKGKVPKKTTMSARTFSAWSPKWADGAISYTWSGGRGEYEATATVNPARLDIKAYVDTKKSWVKADDQTPELLGHERGHFAITHVIGEKTEVTARKAAGSETREAGSKQAAIKAAMAAAQGPVFAAFDHGWKVARYAQCVYDGTAATGTDHGRRPKQQAAWAAAIAADLPKFPVPMPGVDGKLSAGGC